MTSPDRQLAERAVLDAARELVKRNAWSRVEDCNPNFIGPGNALRTAIDALDAIPSPPEPGAGTDQLARLESRSYEVNKRLDAIDERQRTVDDGWLDVLKRLSALERPPAAAKPGVTAQDVLEVFSKTRSEEAAAIRLQTIRECDAALEKALFLDPAVYPDCARAVLARMMEGT